LLNKWAEKPSLVSFGASFFSLNNQMTMKLAPLPYSSTKTAYYNLRSFYKRPTLPELDPKDQTPLSCSFIAGLLDGDGHFVIRKNSCEIRLVGSSLDLPLFAQLENQLGGEVRQEAKKLAIRYFLNAKNSKGGKEGLLELIHGLNGHIRKTVRLSQFIKLCAVYNIIPKDSKPITCEDG
jgi:hypothetical protein